MGNKVFFDGEEIDMNELLIELVTVWRKPDLWVETILANLSEEEITTLEKALFARKVMQATDTFH